MTHLLSLFSLSFSFFFYFIFLFEEYSLRKKPVSRSNLVGGVGLGEDYSDISWVSTYAATTEKKFEWSLG